MNLPVAHAGQEPTAGARTPLVGHFAGNRVAWVFLLVLTPLHLVLVHHTVGLRLEHFALDALFAILLLSGGAAGRLAVTALPFWLVAVLYEALPLFLPLRGPVHVADLYFWELTLFGIRAGDETLIPSAWLGRHLHPALDLAMGFAYLVYLFETFALALYLHVRRSPRVWRLVIGFLVVNIAGMSTYVLFPAAPPWYVDLYGLGPAWMDAPPSAAGTARFDALLGTEVFASFYARNVNVFGAMPSLHVAYPTLAFWVARPLGRWFAVATAGFLLWVSFAAVYLNHHYVLDVLAGLVYGTAAYLVVAWILPRVRRRWTGSSNASPSPELATPPLSDTSAGSSPGR